MVAGSVHVNDHRTVSHHRVVAHLLKPRFKNIGIKISVVVVTDDSSSFRLPDLERFGDELTNKFTVAATRYASANHHHAKSLAAGLVLDAGRTVDPGAVARVILVAIALIQKVPEEWANHRRLGWQSSRART